MEAPIEILEKEVATLKERNKRVESDKAWETSKTRLISILIITYVVACIAMYSIGNDSPARNALIPTLGFFLSTQSLPFLKQWWISRLHE